MAGQAGKGLRDVTQLLESCYEQTPSHEQWAADVAGAFRDAFPFITDAGVQLYRCEPSMDRVSSMVTLAPPAWRSIIAEFYGRNSLRAVRPLLYPGRLVNRFSDNVRCVPPAARAYLNERLTAVGLLNGLALVVHPAPDIAGGLFGQADPGMVLDRRQRSTLARVALHFESAFRMRVGNGAVRAVLGTDGRIVDGDVTATEQAQYTSAARSAETARSTRDPSLWTALVAGTMSVVPRMRGSRRVYELVENAREARPLRALSRREVDVLELAAKGLSTKLCSYALGMSSSTISTTLANAALKIGATSRLELLRIAALLVHDPRASADEATLTAAETEILALVREGLSNAEIAARRGRSVRTIANQIASLLAKTGVPSRRALIAGGVLT